MVRELDVWGIASVGVDRAAHAGAERDDHLGAVAFDDAEALHAGVVQDARRFLELRRERLRELELAPRFAEVRRAHRDAADDHAGEADRDAIEFSEWCDE